MPVVERIQGGDLVSQSRVRQEQIIDLGTTEPPKPPKGGQHLGEGTGLGGDQEEHGQVFLDLGEDLPVGNVEPGQNGKNSHTVCWGMHARSAPARARVQRGRHSSVWSRVVVEAVLGTLVPLLLCFYELGERGAAVTSTALQDIQDAPDFGLLLDQARVVLFQPVKNL